ncbi:hypothetical protein GE061_006853 [Apolygus lucorum]|uniref:Uncharacterized protein n=1 Tax=Apolygus lucorum TaxID=248454 RepID=A0A8S9WPI1_APOLU|nr:hypothetical protein GE061_006853 [Apolygus lucorum]
MSEVEEEKTPPGTGKLIQEDSDIFESEDGVVYYEEEHNEMDDSGIDNSPRDDFEDLNDEEMEEDYGGGADFNRPPMHRGRGGFR